MRSGPGSNRCCRIEGSRVVVTGGSIELQGEAHAAGELEWVVSADSTIARANQHAPAPAVATPGAVSNHKDLRAESADHALGRSRGGLTTRAHLSVDRCGRPLSVLLTPGQAPDNPLLIPVLEAIAVPARGGGPRPRSRRDCLIADKAHSHLSTRKALRQKGIRAVIPENSDQLARRQAKGSRGGRPPEFDAETCRDRNLVERTFNRLKQWRGIATRYDKHARNHRAGTC
jgi:transposase